MIIAALEHSSLSQFSSFLYTEAVQEKTLPDGFEDISNSQPSQAIPLDLSPIETVCQRVPKRLDCQRFPGPMVIEVWSLEVALYDLFITTFVI
ncbi:hypothetical protein TNCV_2223921 [Trichonephila clavipes]|nr:hypothetical protein TNCV_2223921 [Trichonephila clavipes]